MCGYSSFKASYLKAHMLVHSGVKPFVCKKCSFSCTQAGDLKTHMLNHSGEKPFSSQKFEFSCTTVSNLKKHTLIHSGQKPFHCTVCNFSCTPGDSLRTDMIANPFRRKALQLQTVWLLLHNSFLPQETHKNTFGRKTLQSVTSPTQKLVTSINTCWYIQEEILSFAHNVNTPAHKLVT